MNRQYQDVISATKKCVIPKSLDEKYGMISERVGPINPSDPNSIQPIIQKWSGYGQYYDFNSSRCREERYKDKCQIYQQVSKSCLISF